MKRSLFLLSFLLLGMLLSPALAEDAFTIDVDTLNLSRLNSDEYVRSMLSSDVQGIRVRKHLNDTADLPVSVRLTVTEMHTRTLVLDKNYGYHLGVFDSGVIYLPYMQGDTTSYLLTLYLGDYVYAIPYLHMWQQPLEAEDDYADPAGRYEGYAAPNDSNGWADTEEANAFASPDDSWDASDNWSDGWDDDWIGHADGWEDDWTSQADGWEH